MNRREFATSAVCTVSQLLAVHKGKEAEIRVRKASRKLEKQKMKKLQNQEPQDTSYPLAS